MRIAVVTGASSGLGREFARMIPRFYKNLDELWLVARRGERLRELGEEISIPVRIFDSDLTRDYIYEKIGRELERSQADIRMLVNAAGYGKVGSAQELECAEQTGMPDLNCKALTRMTLLCLKYCSRGSRIINIASAAAFAPQPGFAVYAATKSYVLSFSEGLSGEVEKRGIVVTAVCPGPVDTEFFDRAGGDGLLTKSWLMAKPADVVRTALLDSRKGKKRSVYGWQMKAAMTGAKLLPSRFLLKLMSKMNL